MKMIKSLAKDHGLYAGHQFFYFLAIHIYWFCYGWLHEMG
mgnify:CR=1 FL=1